jgi:peptidoglycan/xylan/chitin deacetylase (PgdA/CDA1 family)
MTETPRTSGFTWPGQARIAVAVTCLLENWADGKGPPFSVQTTALKPGTPDRAAASWGTYGGRAGVWRLLKILDRHGVKATFCANAHSLELAPEATAQMCRSGHEVAAHSYTQDTILAYLDAEEERAVINRCVDIIVRLTGAPPKGWLSPVLASTARTEELLTAAGFLWHGDCNHVDLPCCTSNRNGTIVAFPHTDFADHRVLRGNPRDWYEVYKDSFDYLHGNEPTSFLNVTVHCHFGGRPLMAAQFDRILAYLRGFPDVWFARHDEIAQFVRDHAIGEWSNRERFYPPA